MLQFALVRRLASSVHSSIFFVFFPFLALDSRPMMMISVMLLLVIQELVRMLRIDDRAMTQAEMRA